MVRRPRVRLTLNGIPVPGCRNAEIVSPRNAQAATFRVSVNIDDVNRVLGRAWVDQSKLDVSVDFGFLPPGASEKALAWKSMLTGSADRITLDQISGLASLDGRDHAARLIDLPLQTGYLNSTSSELAQALALRGDLSSNVDATAGLIGQYYQIEHTKNALGSFSRHSNGWDMLTELAEIEGFNLWVTDKTLYFKRPVMANGQLYDVVYTAANETAAAPMLTISDLSMERAYGLSGNLQVKVASWNSRQRRQITATYPSNGIDNAARQFFVLKPNLLPDDAEKLAETTYMRLRTHQYVITGKMAGELTLTPQHRLRLSGTGTGWDRIYTIDRIEREMSFEGGYTQSITARSDPEGVINDG